MVPILFPHAGCCVVYIQYVPVYFVCNIYAIKFSMIFLLILILFARSMFSGSGFYSGCLWKLDVFKIRLTKWRGFVSFVLLVYILFAWLQIRKIIFWFMTYKCRRWILALGIRGIRRCGRSWKRLWAVNEQYGFKLNRHRLQHGAALPVLRLLLWLHLWKYSFSPHRVEPEQTCRRNFRSSRALSLSLSVRVYIFRAGFRCTFCRPVPRSVRVALGAILPGARSSGRTRWRLHRGAV